MSKHLGSGLALLLTVVACTDRPPHVVLRIEDPKAVAVGFDRIEVGTSLDRLTRVELSRTELPLSVTITAERAGEQDLWVEVDDASGTAMARGFTRARFARKGTPTASVELTGACSDATACDDGVYCNGVEGCTDGRCTAGSDPCGASFTCVVSACLEVAAQCDVSVDHAECDLGTYCDPMAGCVPGQSCLVDADCQDGSFCNGSEVCVGFHCAPGELPDVDDEDDCTIDGCNDAATPAELHVPDPSRDGYACTQPNGSPGICIADQGGCVESLCGDGFVDATSEDCDDDSANPNDGCHQCLHTRWTPEVIVGNGTTGDDPLRLNLRSPQGLAVDRNGRIFIADPSRARVWLVDPSGAVTVAAGTGESGDDGDGGPAAQARLSSPQGLAVDWVGNLYLSDVAAHRVRKVCFEPAGCAGTSLGDIITVAGTGVFGDASGDGGPATLATLSGPQSVAVDGRGNLFIADSENNRIRWVCVDPGGCDGLAYGQITTLAGGDAGGEVIEDILATDAVLAMPLGVAADSAGNVIISDTQNNVIRLVCRQPLGCSGTPYGYITRLAGNGEWFAPLNDGGPAQDAGLFYTAGVAVDESDNVLISEMAGNRVRFVCRQAGGCGTLADGFIDTIAGGGLTFADNVPAVDTLLSSPWHAVADNDGNILIADHGHRRVRRVCRIDAGCDGAALDHIATIAGGTSATARNHTPATSAPMYLMYGVAIGPSGHLVVGDGTNHLIVRTCRVATGCGALSFGDIETVAGNAEYNASGDGGPALDAGLAAPAGIGLDAAGNIYLAEQSSHTVRKVCMDPAGCGAIDFGDIDTVAGGGSGDVADGGPATGVSLGFMNGLGIDAVGDLIIVGAHRVFRVCQNPAGCGATPSGHIETLAGTTQGFGGDGGPASAALLSLPTDVTSDPLNNLYIADSGNQRVRSICRAAGGCGGDPVGTIRTVAGGGTELGDGGLATAAQLDEPYGVAITPDGMLAIADYGANRIRLVCLMPGGCSGLPANRIDTLAGTGDSEFAGDGGPAIDAGLRAHDLASDVAGNLYFSFPLEPRVRFICRDASGCGEVRTGEIVTVMGPVNPEGDGPFVTGSLGTPFDGVWLDSQRLLVADGASGRLRLTDFASERVITVAGYPSGFYGKPAPLDRARYADLLGGASGIVEVTFGADREIWFSQHTSHDLYRMPLVNPDVSLSWTLKNLQEVRDTPGHVDGALSNALFESPAGMVFDSVRRRIYVADSGNHVIREIDVDAETITTIAGSPHAQGYHGDLVDPLDAVFNRPTALALWAPDHLYVADTGNHRVRRINLATHVIEDIIGDGTPSASGTGTPARHFPVYEPQGLALDRFGNLFATSRYAVREILAGADGLASGDDEVTTIYGLPPRDASPESATICLTGLTFIRGTADDDQLLVFDACQGFLLRLTRGS